jgi:endonuclease/exonuclease/phosphatase family metal-dependent hydrolase
MTELTVATINLRNNANRWLQRRQLLVAQVVDAAPDLVSLQEISLPINQGPWLCSQINWRISGSAKRPYQLIQRRKRHLVNGYFEGIGILTRLPVVYHDLISLGYGGRLAVRANVQVSSRQIVDFVAVHLHHVSYEREARTEQVMKLVGWLNGHRRIHHQIVAGDFNETPDGPAISYMKQSYRSAYFERHGHEPYGIGRAVWTTSSSRRQWVLCNLLPCSATSRIPMMTPCTRQITSVCCPQWRSEMASSAGAGFPVGVSLVRICVRWRV